jgi:hypothetical protein
MANSPKAAGRSGSYQRRLASNFRREPKAGEIVGSWGISSAEAALLGLGIKEPYAASDGRVVSGVLSYPLPTVGGRQRFGCVNVDGLTGNPEHPIAWNAGEPATVMLGSGEGMLIVSASPICVWRLGLAASRVGADVTVIASSQPDRLPAEWEGARFWGRWPRIVVMSDVPTSLRDAIATAARRPLELGSISAPKPRGASTARADEDWLGDLIDGVRGTSDGDGSAVERSGGGDVGDFLADPIALHGGFARGNLLYPFRVERRARAGREGSRLVHSYETLILRGDGAVLEAEVLPAPPGTPSHRRVHALTDGTRIIAAPEQSRTASWSLDGIKAYSAARMQGADPCGRSPDEILNDVHELITSRVTLPRPADAWIVTGFVMLSHVFRLFDALPLLLVVGEKGSGKSELASAVGALGFNATIMAQGSAAAMVRLSAECGGLIILDDVEGLRTEAGAFCELAQSLKTGYKAATARKPVTAASGRIEVFDFYGPRLITSTRGVDPVLASRCIRIETRIADTPHVASEIEPATLRDELHALAMSRAGRIHEAYIQLATGARNRADEISIPLLAIADALNCAGIRDAMMCADQLPVVIASQAAQQCRSSGSR